MLQRTPGVSLCVSPSTQHLVGKVGGRGEAEVIQTSQCTVCGVEQFSCLEGGVSLLLGGV